MTWYENILSQKLYA